MSDDETNEAPDGSPKLFKNVTAWIGGATAVVVALGGLAGAYRNIFPEKPAEAADTNGAQAASSAAETEQDESPVTAYTTDDGGSVRLMDGMWVWTTKDGEKYRYKELSNDGTTTVAVLKGGGENGQDVYLRWPNAGGQAFQSFDEQANWSEPIQFTPDNQQAG
jgi:hypothetical protein